VAHASDREAQVAIFEVMLMALQDMNLDRVVPSKRLLLLLLNDELEAGDVRLPEKGRGLKGAFKPCWLQPAGTHSPVWR